MTRVSVRLTGFDSRPQGMERNNAWSTLSAMAVQTSGWMLFLLMAVFAGFGDRAQTIQTHQMYVCAQLHTQGGVHVGGPQDRYHC